MVHHHLVSTPETVRWGCWSGSFPPVMHVRSGDRVTIETLSGTPEDLPAPGSGFAILPEHLAVLGKVARGPGPHLLTGPIWVEDAQPGDTLEVRVIDIALRQDWGWNLQAPWRGTLQDDFQELRRIHVPLDAAAGTLTLPWGQTLPLSPFFGSFGVAPPPAWGALSSREPRAFGGNMDNKELGVGATVYFPVFTEGALFSAGDGHAVQGDGEVCTTALETALTGTFELILRKDMSLSLPRAERCDVWITMGFDEDLDDAAKLALRDMIRLIGELTGLAAADAYTLCSLAADLRVTQMVDGNKGIHCVIRKDCLPRPVSA